MSGNNSISIGGSVQGSALAAGDRNRQGVTYTATADEREEMISALTEIRKALEGLSGPYAAVAQANVDAALTQASEPEPDKSAVGATLEMALGAAQKAAGFAGTLATLAPTLAKLAPMFTAVGISLGIA